MKILDLKAYANSDGLPIMDTIQFDRWTEELGKEKFRELLSEYIAEERPKFPLKQISHEAMRHSIIGLSKFDTTKICKPVEQVEKKVFEKYDDYEYDFKRYGLGLIDAPSTYNISSNYFHQHLRLNCSSYGFRAPIDVWENGNAKDIWRCLGPIWRGINSERHLKEGTYMSAFRLGTYIATQFKPVVAKTLYDMTKARTVLDTSCGWGDRLAGFFSSNAEEFYGCDPNPNTYKQYMKQIEEYSKFFPNKKVKIYNCGAEDLPYDELPDIDCAFTSPPYFSTEQYNKGGDKEENQSWFKFNEYEKWRDEFYLPVAEKTMNKSKFMLVNIMDPKIKNVRYRSSDELINKHREKFLGQIGMVIMQRPQGNAKFKTKEELNEFMAMKYIENIWCFGPKDYDFFSSSRKGTLENFL
jgi:predicted RNA methylase|tara:strand:+ start:51 stop:1283 length:1233 start_codon:yes stop_codon:yes gene_type:complete